KHDFYQTSMRWRSVCNRRDGGSGAVRRRPGLRVFAFSAGFLRDRMNGAFLVLRPLLGRGGLGAPGQPVSREPPGADQAGRRCLGRDVEGNQRGFPSSANGAPQDSRCAETATAGVRRRPQQRSSRWAAAQAPGLTERPAHLLLREVPVKCSRPGKREFFSSRPAGSTAAVSAEAWSGSEVDAAARPEAERGGGGEEDLRTALQAGREAAPWQRSGRGSETPR
ncbi:unnamed protein product, partial [Rangifer tarandus platyrhynchus]